MPTELVPMDRKGHVHLEMGTKAPKVHVGQKVKALVTGTIKEVSEGYDGTGHRVRVEPNSIKYSPLQSAHKAPGDDFHRKKNK